MLLNDYLMHILRKLDVSGFNCEDADQSDFDSLT